MSQEPKLKTLCLKFKPKNLPTLIITTYNFFLNKCPQTTKEKCPPITLKE